MYFDPKSSAFFSNQDSPGLHRLNSTDMHTPGLKSPSIFSTGQVLGSLAGSPEKRFVAKPDMIYISKAQLENELHSFVANLVQQKSVNQGDTLYYLEQLKHSVLNLMRENTRLQSTPQSAREARTSPRNGRDGRLLEEELVNQKNFYEEKIHENSLHITKLEHKVNELAHQCQSLMRINHELSSQMLQLSQFPQPNQAPEMAMKESYASKDSAREGKEQATSRFREVNVELENTLGQLKTENQRLLAVLEKNKLDLQTVQKERDILKYELAKASRALKEQSDLNTVTASEGKDLKVKDLNQNESFNNGSEVQNMDGEEILKSLTKENIELKHLDLLKKQLGDYKSANAILHKKTEKYLLQIEDLNEALKLTNENLEALQNRYITLEKELVNKHKLEQIMNSYMNVISKLEVKIQSITEENATLQAVNEENMMVISELKSQLDQFAEQKKEQECESPFFATPDAKKKGPSELQAHQSGKSSLMGQSGKKAPEAVLLEQEFTRKKFEEKIENALHEKEMEIRAERIKHKNQIEKYNANLEVLSKKILALVTVNEGLGKDLEILKIEFSNYRTVSWSVIQEVRANLDSFKKHDFEISKYLSELEASNGKGLDRLKQSYGELRKDILNADEVIEERRKYL